MNKRGQVTVFVIVGIVIVISVFLIFYFFGDKIKRKTEVEVVFDESSLEPLQNFVGDCIRKYTEGDAETKGALSIVGKQGGDIDPEFYVTYTWPSEDYLSNIAYHCYTENPEACINYRPLLAKHVEEELENYILTGLKGCINLQDIRQEGFMVSADPEENMILDVSIGDYSTIVNLDYPITITKGDFSVSEGRFTETFETPLGKLLDVAKDIVDSEIINGVFYPEGYNDYSNGIVEIEKHLPGDSEKVYRINLRDDRMSSPDDYYFFQFAIRNFVS